MIVRRRRRATQADAATSPATAPHPRPAPRRAARRGAGLGWGAVAGDVAASACVALRRRRTIISVDPQLRFALIVSVLHTATLLAVWAAASAFARLGWFERYRVAAGKAPDA